MRTILITNDDAIHSPGIQTLRNALTKLGGEPPYDFSNHSGITFLKKQWPLENVVS